MITINKLRKFTLVLITMIFCISFSVVAATSHAQSVVGSNAIKAPQQTQDNFQKLMVRVNSLEPFREKLRSSVLMVSSPSHHVERIIAPTGVTEDSQFFIGSVSKQFTAVLLLMALSDKNHGDIELIKQDLHKPISELLKNTNLLYQLLDFTSTPQFKNKKPNNWVQHVTLHQLLSMKSGLSDMVNDNWYKNFGTEALFEPKEYERIMLIQSTYFDRKQNKEGKFKYSNTNYTLIAKVIEEITGKNFITYLNEKIIKPFSLTNTFHPEAGDFREIKAKLHKDNLIIDAGELSLDAVGVAIGAGGIVSTATDLTKWMQALHKEKTVLNKKLYKLLVGKYTKTKGYGEKAEDTLFYGYGLFISNDLKSGSCIFHAGGIGSYRSLVKYNIDLDTYIVILSDMPEIWGKINDVVFAD